MHIHLWAPAAPLLSMACNTACTACPCLQYGHLLNSRFSDSEWGVYLKGGSGGFCSAHAPPAAGLAAYCTASPAAVLHSSIHFLTHPHPTLPAAYFIVAGNEFRRCGTTGFAAGQGTGFEFVTPPWMQYEIYDIKVLLLASGTAGTAAGTRLWHSCCCCCLQAWDAPMRCCSCHVPRK
jgi:hypothetical protein